MSVFNFNFNCVNVEQDFAFSEVREEATKSRVHVDGPWETGWHQGCSSVVSYLSSFQLPIPIFFSSSSHSLSLSFSLLPDTRFVEILQDYLKALGIHFLPQVSGTLRTGNRFVEAEDGQVGHHWPVRGMHPHREWQIAQGEIHWVELEVTKGHHLLLIGLQYHRDNLSTRVLPPDVFLSLQSELI